MAAAVSNPASETAAEPRKWTPEEIAADPDGYFEATLEETKRRSPGQTEEQLRNEWAGVRELMGF